MIALLEARDAGLLQGAQLWRSAMAGVIVGIVALPLAMAFAIASGVRPEQGLYTAVIAGAVVAVFGGSRVQIAGPTGAFVVILSAVTTEHGVDGLLLASAMAGVMLLLMGAARLGSVLRFIPHPVIAGFTAGIGVVIWVGQWKDFFGLSVAPHRHFHETLGALLGALPHLHPATTALGALSVTLTLVVPRLPGLRRLPGPVAALVVVTALQAALELPGVATLGSAFGALRPGLPPIVLPHLTADRVIRLLPSAFTIALLGAIESLLSATVADRMAGTRHNPNQELIGQGLANLLCPLFGGFAATGAIARTATNIRNGANSPVAGLVHSLTLLLVLLLLAPLAARIPLCALSGILFVVAWNMSDAPHFLHLARSSPRPDVAILLLTFFLTVFADLIIAVNVGVILAILLFLKRMSAAVEVVSLDEETLLTKSGLQSLPPRVQVLSIEGPFFFGAVDTLERALARAPVSPRYLVIRLGHVPFMDITGIEALEETARGLRQQGVNVLLCEARSNVLRKLLRAGVLRRQDGRRCYFASLAAAMRACREINAATAPG